MLSSCSDPSEITDTTHDSRAWNQRFTVWITVYLIIFPYRLPVNSATHLWKLHTCILISRYDYKSVSSRIIRHTKHSTFNRVDLLFIFYACYEIISFLCRIWHKNYFIFTLLINKIAIFSMVLKCSSIYILLNSFFILKKWFLRLVHMGMKLAKKKKQGKKINQCHQV